MDVDERQMKEKSWIYGSSAPTATYTVRFENETAFMATLKEYPRADKLTVGLGVNIAYIEGDVNDRLWYYLLKMLNAGTISSMMGWHGASLVSVER